jgi:hypothetical protein
MTRFYYAYIILYVEQSVAALLQSNTNQEVEGILGGHLALPVPTQQFSICVDERYCLNRHPTREHAHHLGRTRETHGDGVHKIFKCGRLANDNEDAWPQCRFIAGRLVPEHPNYSACEACCFRAKAAREESRVLVKSRDETLGGARHALFQPSPKRRRAQAASSFLSYPRRGMHVSTARRVTRSYLSSTVRAAAIAHVDPVGNAWGWFVNDTRRMHLTPMDPEHRGAARVWLERDGYRAFEVDHHQSADLDMDALRASVSKTRDSIESAWILYIAKKGWLRYSPRNAILALHMGTPQQLVRRLRESAYVPEFLHLDVTTNSACLELRANRLIWQGADDGSDADLKSAV